MTESEYLKNFKATHYLILKYMALDEFTFVTIGQSATRETTQKAFSFANQFIQTNNIQKLHAKDMGIFIYLYSEEIYNLNQEELKFEQKKKYRQDRKAFSKLFTNCKDRYLPNIESISFKVKSESKSIRIDSNTSRKLIEKINYNLYQFHSMLEENSSIEKAIRFSIKRKSSIEYFYPLFLYIINEIGLSKVKTCQFISQLIELLGYNLSEKIEQSPQDYIHDIFKKITSNPYNV